MVRIETICSFLLEVGEAVHWAFDRVEYRNRLVLHQLHGLNAAPWGQVDFSMRLLNRRLYGECASG